MLRIKICNGFLAKCNFEILGYMGENNARIINVDQPDIGADTYALRIEYPDGVIYDAEIVDGKLTVTGSMLRDTGIVNCQWIATKGDELIGKSNVFELQIEISIEDGVAVPTYEQAVTALEDMKIQAKEAKKASQGAVTAAEEVMQAVTDIEQNKSDISTLAASVSTLKHDNETQEENIDNLIDRADITDSIMSDVFDISQEIVIPVNRFDKAALKTNTIISAAGVETSNENNSTTGYISAAKGDVIYCAATNSKSVAMTSRNVVYVSEYDSSKKFIARSSQYPCAKDSNGAYVYTVSDSNTAYIRVTDQSSIINNDSKFYAICINRDTSNPFYYAEYFEQYADTKSQMLENIKGRIESFNVDSHVIDCWGDSRVEMIATGGTSFADYLQSKLGDNYNVCNYGISSQSSGMVTARLGSNEVFVTLTNNQIPASGEVQLTDIKCTSGNIANLFAYSATAYVPCVINGVRGRLSKASNSDYTKIKFIRDSDGSAISVKPRTKIVVDDMGSKHHACIFWFGKNDFASAGNHVVDGILDNYANAVKYVSHDKFIILGETCSLTSSFEPDGSDRATLDTINSTLALTYPDNFVDINAYLASEQALTDVGLTATDADTANMEKGLPCEQLMVHNTDSSDIVHPNECGRQAIANKIYDFMSRKGWLD